MIDRRAAVMGVVAVAAGAGRAAAGAEPIRLSEVVRRRSDTDTDTKDAATALAAALRQASAEQRDLLVDGRFSIGHDIPIPGPVRVVGRAGQDDGFDLIAAPATVAGGNHGHLMLVAGQPIDGVAFEHLTFRADYEEGNYAGSRVVPIIRISPRAGIVHRNVSFRQCRFLDPVHNCISASPDMGGRVEGLQVFGCEVDVTVPLNRASRAANLVQTLLQYIDWPGHKASYGTVAIRGVRIERCRARGVRTLADMKRGTAEFVVVNCQTTDMSDCHYSADGAFNGKFARLDGAQRSPLLKAKNFIEVQGEDIEISDFRYQGAAELGAIAGVMITPYAFPVEGRGAVHQSRRIRILDGEISGIGAHAAIRLINAADCEVRGITVDDVNGPAVAIENPRDGLAPSNVVVEDVRTTRRRGPAGVYIAPAARGITVRRLRGFEQAITGGGRAQQD